jgi:hypothetical protein
MRKFATGLALIAGMALAGAAVAAPPQQQPQTGQQTSQGAPQPNHQQQKTGSGLFPPNQPIPMYSSSANGASASLQNPGTPSPNAGSTGLAGSAGSGTGWSAQVYRPNVNGR